jgi:hypothetical protein
VTLLHPNVDGETARLRVEQPGKIDGVGRFYPADPLKVELDAYVIKLNKYVNQISLDERK